MALQIASWAMFLHIAGTLCGAYAGLSTGDAWEMTFQPGAAGQVLLAVRGPDARYVDRAEKILRQKQPLSMERT